MSDLPAYPDAELAQLPLDELIEALIRDEDRVPRNLIDECARRGEDLLERAWEVLQHGPGWEEDATQGEWWLPVHLVMILGLMDSERAGTLLIDFLRKLSDHGDESQESWTGAWPELFRNKPASVIARLQTLSRDRALDWYLRVNALPAVLARTLADGTLEAELEALFALARDEREDATVRLHAAALLVGFPRERYRQYLYALALKQTAAEGLFDTAAVDEAYARGTDLPDWDDDDPWQFYTPEESASRQARWAEETAADDDTPVDPYVREAPKVGRNDACPCGSGRKYKRCCGSD